MSKGIQQLKIDHIIPREDMLLIELIEFSDLAKGTTDSGIVLLNYKVDKKDLRGDPGLIEAGMSQAIVLRAGKNVEHELPPGTLVMTMTPRNFLKIEIGAYPYYLIVKQDVLATVDAEAETIVLDKKKSNKKLIVN